MTVVGRDVDQIRANTLRLRVKHPLGWEFEAEGEVLAVQSAWTRWVEMLDPRAPALAHPWLRREAPKAPPAPPAESLPEPASGRSAEPPPVGVETPTAPAEAPAVKAERTPASGNGKRWSYSAKGSYRGLKAAVYEEVGGMLYMRWSEGKGFTRKSLGHTDRLLAIQECEAKFRELKEAMQRRRAEALEVAMRSRPLDKPSGKPVPTKLCTQCGTWSAVGQPCSLCGAEGKR